MAVLELKLAFMQAKGTKKSYEIAKQDKGDTVLIDTGKIGEIVANKEQYRYFDIPGKNVCFNVNTLITDQGREYYLYEDMETIKEKWKNSENRRPVYQKLRGLSRNTG
ncbi:MAG: hypothetical protein EA357_10740 [Micavibrio sp.]|nr:MAG: hypothetical protein EA357_10740 [Micavibrio sp.]